MNPVTNMIYVADPGSDIIFVIDWKTNNIAKSISLVNPNLSDVILNFQEKLFNTYTNLVYPTNSDSTTLTIIDGETTVYLHRDTK